MKTTTLIFLTLLFASLAHAEQVSCPSPAPVKKVHHKAKKKTVVAPAPKCETKTVEVVREIRTEKRVEVLVKAPVRKNRIKILGGYGPTGFDLTSDPTRVRVESKYGAVLGIGYGRLITDRVSIEGNLLTNGTGLVGVGYDW